MVDPYNNLAELMLMAAQGKVKLHASIHELEDPHKAIDDLIRYCPFSHPASLSDVSVYRSSVALCLQGVR